MPIDHLVYAGPSLDEATLCVEELLGRSLLPGGQHLGFGTRNRLLDLGRGAYLEVIGPDLDQPDPAAPRPFGIDDLRAPRLVAWAAQIPDIDSVLDDVRQTGLRLGTVMEMTRQTPDGRLLRWRLTPPQPGVMPFLIDWGDTLHPTASLPAAASLIGLTVTTAEPDDLRRLLDVLALDVEVRHGDDPRLTAEIDVDGRSVELA